MSTTVILQDQSRAEIAVPGHRPRLSAGVIAYIERPGTDWDLYAGEAIAMPGALLTPKDKNFFRSTATQ